MNTSILSLLICSIAGYFIGTLNPAFITAKLHGFDIREHGSGNAGATNVMITIGKGIGFVIAVCDILKAFFAVKLAGYLFPHVTYVREFTGVAVILGHIFPCTMGFRGGKGLACLGGVILAFSAKVFWIMLGCEILLAFLVDYICVVPITASISFPAVYWFLTKRLLGTTLYAALAPIFFYKHLENLRRIREGKEARFSYLWRKDEEVVRLTEEARKR